MPKGKSIYDDLSKKYSKRRKAREELMRAASVDEDGHPISPPVVNNFVTNKPKMARSLNIQPTTPKRRKVSPNEGKQTVNSSSDTKHLVHKPEPISSSPLDNPTAGAIKDGVKKKKRGRPKGSKNKKVFKKVIKKTTR